MIEKISASIVPAVVALCGFLILISKKPLFDAFISGAKRGFSTSVELFPTLCVLFCGVSMLQNCGFTDLASRLLTKIGIPDGLAPFLLLRPISGAASTAMLSDIFAKSGADSRAGIIASIIMGSSDTLIYIVSVYQSAAGIRKSRGVLIPAFLAMIAVCATAILIS